MNNKIIYTDSNKLSHIIWCALTALQISRIEKKVPFKNRVAANKYIGEWAGVAIKDGRFGAEFKNELLIWHTKALTKASICNLEKSLNTVLVKHEAKKEHVKTLPGSFKRRLENAGTEIDKLGWYRVWGLKSDSVVITTEKNKRENSVFILDKQMERFDNKGLITSNISVMAISNDLQPLVDCFYQSGLILYFRSQNHVDGKKHYIFSIHANNYNDGSVFFPPSKIA